MASPIFHGLAGAGLAYALAGDGSLPLFASLRKFVKLLPVVVLLVCLPDVDYIPGWVRGYLNTTHQQVTHSVGWVLLVAAGIGLVGRAWRPEWFGWRAAVFLAGLMGSHLAIDWMTADRLAPYGIPLWFPFSDQTLHGPLELLPAWNKMTLSELGSWKNFRVLVFEVGVGGMFAMGCIAIKRGWTWQKAAL